MCKDEVGRCDGRAVVAQANREGCVELIWRMWSQGEIGSHKRALG